MKTAGTDVSKNRRPDVPSDVKRKILISTLFCLLPALVGLFVYTRLPDAIAVHFDWKGTPDSWMSKPLAIFGMPGFMAAVNLFVLWMSVQDPKKQNIQGSVMTLMYFLIPIIGTVMMSALYMHALGIHVNMGMAAFALIGIIMIALGNVLPKAKQNYVFGVRTAWTMNDPENWIMTNRFAGRCMVVAGFIVLALCWLDGEWTAYVMLGSLLGVSFLSIWYSWHWFKTHPNSDPESSDHE